MTATQMAAIERRKDITSTRKYWSTLSLSAPERAWGTWKTGRINENELAHLVVSLDKLNPEGGVVQFGVGYIPYHVLEDKHLFFVRLLADLRQGVGQTLGRQVPFGHHQGNTAVGQTEEVIIS